MTLTDWLTLPDADLCDNLGPLSDWLEERGDERANQFRLVETPVWSYYHQMWTYKIGSRRQLLFPSDGDPTVHMAAEVRRKFGCERCLACGGSGVDPYLDPFDGDELVCEQCAGRGWLLPTTTTLPAHASTT